MRELQITIMLSIDEIGKVKLTNVGFIYKGCKDATLFAGEVTGEEAPFTEEVQAPTLKISTAASQAALLALAKLGFSDEEAQSWASSVGEKRIADVAAWIERKNGVGSPKKLAEKLFKLA